MVAEQLLLICKRHACRLCHLIFLLKNFQHHAKVTQRHVLYSQESCKKKVTVFSLIGNVLDYAFLENISNFLSKTINSIKISLSPRQTSTIKQITNLDKKWPNFQNLFFYKNFKPNSQPSAGTKLKN
jgi:hypothetical protein